MITLLFLRPSLEVLAGILALHLLWWSLADVVLEHVGIPFLDARSGRTNGSELREPEGAGGR
jgi:hypothetical protein